MPQAAMVSDAEYIPLLYAENNGHWWDHTDVTVAVRTAPNTDPALVAATQNGIATWNEFLRVELAGLITLTDITGTRDANNADIKLHYVPHAGGAVFAGLAVCRAMNARTSWLVLISHNSRHIPLHWFMRSHCTRLGALGLGHAEPLLTTSDLMGYGWYFRGDPHVMSACDAKALRAVFQWAVDGSEPHPPRLTAVEC